MIGQETLLRFVSRNWPFENGAGRIIDRFGAGIDLGAGERICRTRDGFEMSVLADDLIGRHLILSGNFDRAMLGVLLDFSQPNDRCIDIGANIGYVSCLMLQTIPGSHVLAIEPQPSIVHLTERNLARFPSERWTLLKAGLSDSESEGRLKLDAVNRGASRLVTGGTESEGTVSVPLLPAAKVLGELETIDLIKMDIEGHEEAVFRSARDILDARQPRAILFEDQLGKAGPDGSIGNVLDAIGYRLYGIEKHLARTVLRNVTGENAGHFNDFIALSTRRTLPQPARARYGV